MLRWWWSQRSLPLRSVDRVRRCWSAWAADGVARVPLLLLSLWSSCCRRSCWCCLNAGGVGEGGAAAAVGVHSAGRSYVGRPTDGCVAVVERLLHLWPWRNGPAARCRDAGGCWRPMLRQWRWRSLPHWHGTVCPHTRWRVVRFRVAVPPA